MSEGVSVSSTWFSAVTSFIFEFLLNLFSLEQSGYCKPTLDFSLRSHPYVVLELFYPLAMTRREGGAYQILRHGILLFAATRARQTLKTTPPVIIIQSRVTDCAFGMRKGNSDWPKLDETRKFLSQRFQMYDCFRG